MQPSLDNIRFKVFVFFFLSQNIGICSWIKMFLKLGNSVLASVNKLHHLQSPTHWYCTCICLLYNVTHLIMLGTPVNLMQTVMRYRGYEPSQHSFRSVNIAPSCCSVACVDVLFTVLSCFICIGWLVEMIVLYFWQIYSVQRIIGHKMVRSVLFDPLWQWNVGSTFYTHVCQFECHLLLGQPKIVLCINPQDISWVTVIIWAQFCKFHQSHFNPSFISVKV